jgi:hypothetical protein
MSPPGSLPSSRADPPDPSLHVDTKPGAATCSRLLLIKPAYPCDEMFQGLGGHRQAAGAKMIAEEVKAFGDPPDKGFVGVLGQAQEANIWFTTLTAARRVHRVGASTRMSSM